VQGFLFEGSPQFTGVVPSYATLDAQLNKQIPKLHLTVKIGASNLLSQKHFEAYGGRWWEDWHTYKQWWIFLHANPSIKNSDSFQNCAPSADIFEPLLFNH
jgi:outer membrane receptor protein involved in Fe transport